MKSHYYVTSAATFIYRHSLRPILDPCRAFSGKSSLRKLVRFFDWPPTPHPVADFIDSGLKPGMVGANQRYAGHD